VVQSEEVRELKYSVTLLLAGKHLDKKDLFGKSDPFVVISRSAEGGQYVSFHFLAFVHPLSLSLSLSLSRSSALSLSLFYSLHLLIFSSVGFPQYRPR
jgi:hypothetical protein